MTFPEFLASFSFAIFALLMCFLTIGGALDPNPPEGRALAIESEVIRTDGLGFWCTILECGEQIAANRKKRFTWDHVIDAHAALNGNND